MILGIGIDTVEIQRFAQWHTKSAGTLARIFGPEEISYCLEQPAKSAERFAVRYAAKEAFYKALCSYTPDCKIPFIAMCKQVKINRKPTGVPELLIQWPMLGIKDVAPLLTMTHTNHYATAIVVLTN